LGADHRQAADPAELVDPAIPNDHLIVDLV